MTRPLKVGSVQIGGQNKVVIQSMTNTKTKDVEATVAQINALAKNGAAIVRLAVFDLTDALALRAKKSKTSVPLVADIHFDYRLALASIANGIDKIRLNPGNISDNKTVFIVLNNSEVRG